VIRRLFLALLLAGGPAAAQGLDAAGGRLRQELLLPLYAAYLDQARAFAAATPDCAGDWRAPMRPAYAGSVLAWRRLEAAGTRPATAGETPSTVYFWPDKHGTAGRQLGAALRDRDPALTEPAALAAKSVGLQSLATLEVLLYGDRVPTEADGFACRYAQAIAGLQAEVVARLAGAAPRDPASDLALAEAMFRGMQGTLASSGRSAPTSPPPEASAPAPGAVACRCR
jgi:predicted lipoprotein